MDATRPEVRGGRTLCGKGSDTKKPNEGTSTSGVKNQTFTPQRHGIDAEKKSYSCLRPAPLRSSRLCGVSSVRAPSPADIPSTCTAPWVGVAWFNTSAISSEPLDGPRPRPKVRGRLAHTTTVELSVLGQSPGAQRVLMAKARGLVTSSPTELPV